ncbi:alpha/beta hydrolase [Marinicella sediminis]|uniref:Alpha/beta hydrolase n=1 Tax=Marinicella sediminis TaxID=1792834 RepID=A0ABV7JG65_9GAMM|nr:alpha/beta fold hydrolase [Marinicella sediminis]
MVNLPSQTRQHKNNIILIHGLGLGDWVFNEQFVPYFQSQGYEVTLITLPGHSAQDDAGTRQHISLQRCIAHVKNTIKQITGPYVLIGMSMGGGICQHIMADAQGLEQLKGAILLSSVPPTNSLVFTLRMCQKMAVQSPDVLIDFFCNKTNQKLIFSPHSLTHMPAKTIDHFVNQIIPGFALLEYEVFFQDLFKKAPQINHPLMVIGGQEDALFPAEVTQFLASYYNTTPHILPDLGHMIPIETNYLHSLQVMEPFLHEVFR